MNDFDLKEIERETRFMVDLINQNPAAFSNNPAGIPAVPLDIMILAQNFASDKYLGNVKAFERFLGDIPDDQWKSVEFVGSYGDDTAHYLTSDTLQGLTPENVHKSFMEGIQSYRDSLPNVANIAEHYYGGRHTVSMVSLSDYLPVEDFNSVFIFNTERIIQNQAAGLVRDAIELTRPKTALELELHRILEDNANPSNPHDDIIISNSETPLHDFPVRKRNFAGKTDETRNSIKNKLTQSIERLLERLNNPDLNDSKKWITATIPFSAYNVVTGNAYSSENQAFAEMYSEECNYETGCYISAKQAMERGFSIAGAKTQVFTQRYPVELNATEIVNGVKQNKLNEDGTPQKFKFFTIGYVNMMNIDELKWTHNDKPDPRIKWKEQYRKGTERKPCNQEKLEIFIDAMLELDYVKVKFGQSSNSYDVHNDEVHMKNRNQFRNDLRFLHTMLHEMAHASGHKSRNNREKLYTYHDDIANRGEEELTANRICALVIEKYGLHESELKDSYEANNLVYDLGWAKRAYEKNPLSLLDTIGNAEFGFKSLQQAIDAKLEQKNVLHLFTKNDVEFEGMEPKTQVAKKDYNRSNKSTYKQKVTA